MRPLPHRYSVTSVAAPNIHVRLKSSGIAELPSEPPVEFGGPGDLWSPETLLMAAISDCFTLTFRAAANLTKLDWNQLECTANGTLDRVDGVTRFVRVDLNVSLSVPNASDVERARRLLEKTERGCLVSNSLNCERTLEVAIDVDAARQAKTA